MNISQNKNSDLLQSQQDMKENDPKKQIEKLLNACDLKWNENCMKFYNNKHFISTGSNSINIHQPIYKLQCNLGKVTKSNYNHF